MIAPASTLPSTGTLFYDGTARIRGLDLLDGVDVRPTTSLPAGSENCEDPCVLVVDESFVHDDRLPDRLPEQLIVIAADASAQAALGDVSALSLAGIHDDDAKVQILSAAFQMSQALINQRQLLNAAELYQNEVKELNRIGLALLTQHDRDALLKQIVTQGIRLTTSDAAALYLIEKDEKNVLSLRFKLVLIESAENEVKYPGESWPADSSSLVGHVATTGEPLVLDDIRNLPADAPYSVNPFAENRGYWIKSMLTIPMLNHLDEVVGVLQLANRKPSPDIRILTEQDAYQHVLPYSKRDVHFGLSLAGHAGVLIDNANLYAQVDELFSSFVKAAVTAIDQRDPSTAGHSVRVATLVTDLAKALERSASGPYRDIRFSHAQIRELRYAALLHDFGKIGVREDLLTKGKKLPAVLEERVHARFELIRTTMQLHYERERMRLSDSAAAAALTAEFNEQLAQLEDFQSAVAAANEPRALSPESAALLADVANRTFLRRDGHRAAYLQPDELHYLMIAHGSLDEEELREMQTHATQTLEFLSQIPWTEDLKDITIYASTHHERLDGSGYPQHLRNKSVPVQTRMLTIVDIFDALTASDRPYRLAVSPQRALDIIRREVNAGGLDKDIFDVMLSSGVYRRILEEDWRQF